MIKNVVLKFIITSILLQVCRQANLSANSFVGNGGSAGDIELTVTKNQILESLKAIINYEINLECECLAVFQNKNECLSLKNLNKEQAKFCSKKLYQVAPELVSILEDQKITFNWTEKNIFVTDNQNSVAADAVADSKDKTVTINKSTFLKLPQTKRIFLLAHEILHLIKIDGDYLNDSGTIGPYDSDQGQRQLLNAMASDLVMKTYQFNLFNKYNSTLARGQNHNLNWLDLDLNHSIGLASKDNSYDLSKHSGLGLTYKRFFGSYGLNLSVKFNQAEENLLSDITVKEKLNIYSIGLAYRIFMGDDPLTSFGQSFLNFDLNVDLISSDYELSDSFVGSKSGSSGYGISSNVKYYYPFSSFWVTFGLGLSYSDYEVEELSLDKKRVNVLGNIGVSYGF